MKVTVTLAKNRFFGGWMWVQGGIVGQMEVMTTGQLLRLAAEVGEWQGLGTGGVASGDSFQVGAT